MKKSGKAVVLHSSLHRKRFNREQYHTAIEHALRGAATHSVDDKIPASDLDEILALAEAAHNRAIRARADIAGVSSLHFSVNLLNIT